MIDRYTIKFGPAVSQKDMEKALNDPSIHAETEVSKLMHKMKVRIEFIGDFEDVKKVKEFIKQHSKNDG